LILRENKKLPYNILITMKSYTDLDQSCILADILLLDSADCFYRRFVDNYNAIQYTLEMYPYNKGADKIHDLPCWSLSALLDALPRIEHLRPSIDLNPKLDSNEVAIYYHSEDSPYIVKDNLIDAAFAMVMWLKENKKI
jgi:hypothetical protein